MGLNPINPVKSMESESDLYRSRIILPSMRCKSSTIVFPFGLLSLEGATDSKPAIKRAHEYQKHFFDDIGNLLILILVISGLLVFPSWSHSHVGAKTA